VAKKRFVELKNLTQDELNTRLREAEKVLFESRMKKVTGQLTNTAGVWKTRKDIARMKMILQERAQPGKTAAGGK